MGLFLFYALAVVEVNDTIFRFALDDAA